MSIELATLGIELVGGELIGRGIQNVMETALGWTVNAYTNPVDRALTKIGVFAIGRGAAKMVCDMWDEALDVTSDGIVKVMDKMDEFRDASDDPYPKLVQCYNRLDRMKKDMVKEIVQKNKIKKADDILTVIAAVENYFELEEGDDEE